MLARMLSASAGGMALLVAAATPAAAQVSGRVVLDQGPIAVDIVFGTHPDAGIRHPRVVRYGEPVIVRYRRGMSERQLELYLARIEYEYDLYRHMDGSRAYRELGWTHRQHHAYVRWLRDERRFLRAERARLERLHRAGRRGPPGHARGRAVAAAASHRW